MGPGIQKKWPLSRLRPEEHIKAVKRSEELLRFSSNAASNLLWTALSQECRLQTNNQEPVSSLGDSTFQPIQIIRPSLKPHSTLIFILMEVVGAFNALTRMT
jgi:hypothetical protein